jgi:peptidyl-tRNA hydrolase, PTH2 family
MDFSYKMVLVTRKDLKLSPGKLAAQVAHAAVACTLETKRTNGKWFRKWMDEGAKKAVVKVDTLDDFYTLKSKASDLKIVSYLVVDAGHTEIPEGTITVLGVGPAPDNIIDQVTGNLSLL